MSNPVSILGGDPNTPQWRQQLQDALDTLYGLIQKAGGTAAGPTTFDELRVRMLTVLGTIDVVPEDKPPANVNSRLVTPWLTGQRGRGQVWRFEDQQDGGNLLEVRSQPYLIGTPTATAGDWEFRFYSAQRDPAGAYRSLGAIRFGSDGRIRTYDASEVVAFDSNAAITTTKGDLIVNDGGGAGSEVRLAAGADGTILVSDSAQPTGRDNKTIADILTDEGIDFTTGSTTGRAPVTQEYENAPGTATDSWSATESLGVGQTWRVTVWGDATGGTAFIKYAGTTLTSATGSNPFCAQALVSRKTASSVECTGFFASDGGTTILTPTITSVSLNAVVDVSAGTGGTIAKWIVERIGDTAAGTAGGSGGLAGDDLALYIPTPSFHFDAQYGTSVILSGSNVIRWEDTAGNLLHAEQGTATNQPVTSGSAKTSGVDFDGNDNYLVFSGTLTGLTSTSGELRGVFELDGLGTDGTIFAIGNSGSSTQYFGLRVNSSNKLEVFENNSGTPDIANGSTTLTTGVMYRFRLVSNSTTWRLYLNGSQETLTVTSGANNGDWWGDVGTRNRLAIGALVRSTVANYFNGKIHELVGWDSAGKLITDRMSTQIDLVEQAYWGLL